jgi:hypothetical protein
MQPLPQEKRAPGQRVQWDYDAPEGKLHYTGVIVPLPEDHPMKAQHEEDRDLVYVMPDVELYPWLQGYPFAYWDFEIEGGMGFGSPLYAEDEE